MTANAPSLAHWRPGVLVTGGRNFRPPDTHGVWLKYWLRAVQPAFFMSGGATGVDTWATDIARAQGVVIQTCPVTPAQWRAHGGSAGPMRNTIMLEAMLGHGGGYCIAFDGGSGTADMLRKARLQGLRIINMQKMGYTRPKQQRSLLLG